MQRENEPDLHREIEATSETDSEPNSRNLTRGLLALIDQGFVSLNNFVTFILVAKFCSREDLNLYVLAWSIFNVFRVIQERGLAAPYFVFAHDKNRDNASMSGSSLVHQVLYAIAVIVLFVSLALIFGWQGKPVGMAACILSLVIASPFVLLRDHLRAISCAHFRYSDAVMLSAIAMLVQIAFILLADWLGRMNVVTVFMAMGVGSLIPCGLWYLLRPIVIRFDVGRFRPDWKLTYAYSKWLVAARIFPSLAMGILPWIVMWAIDEDSAGTLGGCITLANISNMFVFGANYFFLPRAVKALNDNGQAGLTKILIETVVVFSAVLSCLCLVYLFLGNWILVFVFDESFEGYAFLASLIGLSYLIVSFSTIAGNGMTALGSPEGLFWGELAFGIVAIIFGTLLSIQFGLIGTAVALCVASLLATVVETRYLFRLLK